MIRGSIVFLAVFAVSYYSIGVNGAHFIKSGIRGNEDAPGIGESGFDNGENYGRGHYIGKRSLLGLNLIGNLGHDIARLAGIRSAAARRQQMINPNPQFPRPIPPPTPDEVFRPPIFSKPWPYPSQLKSHDLLPLKQAMPSVLPASGLEGDIQPLPMLKFLPLSEMKDKALKIISKLVPASHILPGTLPTPLARSSFARSQNVYRSDLKNRRSGYSGLRSHSPLRSYPSLPDPSTDDILYPPLIPLYKHVRNVARASDLNFRGDRSAVVKYLVQLWNKISKWFKPGSVSGKGMEDIFPSGLIPEEGVSDPEGGEIPIGGGQVPVGDIPVEHLPPDDEIHIEHLPEEEEDPPAVGERPDASEDPVIGGDPTGEGESDVKEDYYKPMHVKPEHYKPVHHTNWEVHSSTGMDYGLGDVNENYFKPIRSRPSFYKPLQHSNWEARSSTGFEDGLGEVTTMIEDTSAATRRKNLRDNMDTLTDIFGRLADD